MDLPQIDTTPRRPAPRPTSSSGPPPWLGGVVAAALVVVGLVAWSVLGPRVAASGMAREMEGQYRMLLDAKATEIDLSVRAGAVAELYLHAHDSEGYERWKAIADRHARNAGIPGQ